MTQNTYKPKPIDTSDIQLPEELELLVEEMSKNMHDVWAETRIAQGWTCGEHLRWNAAHEMLGYVNNTTGHECEERPKRHNCLKPWQELDKESGAVDYIDDYKVFDFGVVETSLKLRCGVEV